MHHSLTKQITIDTDKQQYYTLLVEQYTSAGYKLWWLSFWITIFCCRVLGLCDNENSPITIIQQSIMIITIMPFIYEVHNKIPANVRLDYALDEQSLSK